MGTLPNRHGLHRRNADAYGNLGFSLGLTGGLVLTHYVDIPAETSLVAATGSVIGHIAGDGVAKLDKQKYENTSIGSQIVSLPAWSARLRERSLRAVVGSPCRMLPPL